MFCVHCVHGVSGSCPQSLHVLPWKLITLEPCQSTGVLCDHDDENEQAWGDGDELASDLEVGDHFAVRATPRNKENTKFWILKCLKTLYTVSANTDPDDWGVSVEKGSDVVEGQYYKQSGYSIS